MLKILLVTIAMSRATRALEAAQALGETRTARLNTPNLCGVDGERGRIAFGARWDHRGDKSPQETRFFYEPTVGFSFPSIYENPEGKGDYRELGEAVQDMLEIIHEVDPQAKGMVALDDRETRRWINRSIPLLPLELQEYACCLISPAGGPVRGEKVQKVGLPQVSELLSAMGNLPT